MFEDTFSHKESFIDGIPFSKPSSYPDFNSFKKDLDRHLPNICDEDDLLSGHTNSLFFFVCVGYSLIKYMKEK